jgi:predicted anti-sigma-YlaC factor YlaD
MKAVTLLKTMLGLAPNCKKVNSFLAEYVEGSLPDKTRMQFEEHIGMCKCCGTYFDQYKTTIELMKEGDEVEIPSELVEHTMSFLRKNADFKECRP